MALTRYSGRKSRGLTRPCISILLERKSLSSEAAALPIVTLASHSEIPLLKRTLHVENMTSSQTSDGSQLKRKVSQSELSQQASELARLEMNDTKLSASGSQLSQLTGELFPPVVRTVETESMEMDVPPSPNSATAEEPTVVNLPFAPHQGPGYSRDAIVAGLTDLYQFMERCTWEAGAIEYPPPGGWLELPVDLDIEKTDKVINLIRHLPCPRDWTEIRLLNHSELLSLRNLGYCNADSLAGNYEHAALWLRYDYDGKSRLPSHMLSLSLYYSPLEQSAQPGWPVPVPAKNQSVQPEPLTSLTIKEGKSGSPSSSLETTRVKN